MLEPNDWGLLYGFSLYETILVVNGSPCWLGSHLRRMLTSARVLGMSELPTFEELRDRVLANIHSGLRPEAVLRLTMTAGNPERSMGPQVFLTGRDNPYRESDYWEGVDVIVHDARRHADSILARHKTGNQIESLIAWRGATALGYREALFFNTRNVLAEGARTNVFVIRSGRVTTPPLSAGILPGLARLRAIEALGSLGHEVVEGDISNEDLAECDECFLTNSILLAMPVRRIGTRVLPGRAIGQTVGRRMHDLVKRGIEVTDESVALC